MGESELLDQLLIGSRLFEHVEILTMEVLDQSLLEAVCVIRRLDQDRNGVQPCSAGRTPPSLTGDQFELVRGLVTDATDQHRLEDTELFDGSRQ